MFCLLAAVHVQFKTASSLKTWNEAITLTTSWLGVLNEGGWEPWSTIKALPLWSIWFLFTDACAGPVAVNPEDLPTIQGSSTLRIFLMKKKKCSKRVKQSHVNSAIMIPVAVQFKLICQDGQQGTASQTLDVVCAFTQAHNLLFQSIISKRRHSIMCDLEAEKMSLRTPLNMVSCVLGQHLQMFHESYRAQGYSLINTCYKNINNFNSQKYLYRLTPPFLWRFISSSFFLFREGELRVFFFQRMGFGEHEKLHFFVERF